MRALWVEDQSVIADAIELWLGVAMPELAVDKARSLGVAVLDEAGLKALLGQDDLNRG